MGEGLENGDFDIVNTVSFEGEHSLDIPPVAATVAAGRFKIAVVGGPWEDPPIWTFGKPCLARLRTMIKNSSGEVIDDLSTRFGFREMWVEGNKVMLNGLSIKTGAFSLEEKSTFDWKDRGLARERLRKAMRMGAQFLTGSSEPVLPDICDELGLPIDFRVAKIDLTEKEVGSDKLWIDSARDIEGLVRRLRNHPSICAWRLGGESSEFHKKKKVASTELMNRFAGLADSVDAADGTRIIDSDNALDMWGRLEVFSIPSPVEGNALVAPTTFLPLSRLWRAPANEFEIGDLVPSGQTKSIDEPQNGLLIPWGVKPIFVGEYGRLSLHNPPFGLIEIGGETVFSGLWGTMNAFNEGRRLFIQGDRDAETSLTTICDSSLWDMRKACPSCEITPITPAFAWFGGTDFLLNVNIHHDVPEMEEVDLSWGVVVDGKTNECGSISIPLYQYQLKRYNAALRIPPVLKATKAELFFALVRKNGSILAESRWPGLAVPKKRLSFAEDSKVALFDPLGETKSDFAEAGLDLNLTPLSEIALKNMDILIVGKDCAGNDSFKKHAHLIKEFLAKGGRLLMLQQKTSPPVELTGTPLVPVNGVVRSRCFIRMASHPISEKIDDALLKWWFPNSSSTISPYQKPSSGAARTIIDTADGKFGLEYSTLI